MNFFNDLSRKGVSLHRYISLITLYIKNTVGRLQQ